MGKSFTLAWDQPLPTGGQPEPTSYRFEMNGSQVGQDVSDGALRQFQMTAPAACGSNTLRVASIAGNLVSWSAPLVVNVINCPPPAPTNLRIIVTLVRNNDGTYRPVLTLEPIPTQ